MVKHYKIVALNTACEVVKRESVSIDATPEAIATIAFAMGGKSKQGYTILVKEEGTCKTFAFTYDSIWGE